MKTWRTNRVTRINTARGLLFALSFNLGLKNGMIQLIDINRANLDSVKLIFDKLIKKCSAYYSRANCSKFYKDNANIKIEVWDSSHESNNVHDYYLNFIKNTSFRFLVMAYSNINPAVEFFVDVKKQRLIIDEQATNLILSILEKENQV